MPVILVNYSMYNQYGLCAPDVGSLAWFVWSNLHGDTNSHKLIEQLDSAIIYAQPYVSFVKWTTLPMKPLFGIVLFKHSLIHFQIKKGLTEKTTDWDSTLQKSHTDRVMADKWCLFSFETLQNPFLSGNILPGSSLINMTSL